MRANHEHGVRLQLLNLDRLMQSMVILTHIVLARGMIWSVTLSGRRP